MFQNALISKVTAGRMGAILYEKVVGPDILGFKIFAKVPISTVIAVCMGALSYRKVVITDICSSMWLFQSFKLNMK